MHCPGSGVGEGLGEGTGVGFGAGVGDGTGLGVGVGVGPPHCSWQSVTQALNVAAGHWSIQFDSEPPGQAETDSFDKNKSLQKATGKTSGAILLMVIRIVGCAMR